MWALAAYTPQAFKWLTNENAGRLSSLGFPLPLRENESAGKTLADFIPADTVWHLAIDFETTNPEYPGHLSISREGLGRLGGYSGWPADPVGDTRGKPEKSRESECGDTQIIVPHGSPHSYILGSQ